MTGAGSEGEFLNEISGLTFVESPNHRSSPESWRSPELLVSSKITGALLRAQEKNAASRTVRGDWAAFKWKPLGLGTVTAWRTNDPFENQGANWGFHSVSIMRMGNRAWEPRHGVDRHGTSSEFWNWTVPGVGKAPVGWFRFSITAFVLAVGPLSYFWLRKRGRLNRLLWIVPGSALAVTTSLFVYAILSDGLATRTRVRGYTEIDQRQGRAASIARITYFAGLSPAEGLSFPRDTLVLPCDEFLADAGEPRSVREVNSDGETRRLAKGWFYSRTPTQFVTVTSRKSDAKVEFDEDSGGSLRTAINRLGSRARVLGFCDHAGRFWLAEETGDGERASLIEASSASIRSAMHSPIAAKPMRPPKGYDFRAGSRGLFGFRTRSYVYYSTKENDFSQESALERGIEGAWQGYPGESNGLSPGSYVAIVDRSPELEIGLDSSKEEAGLHVVHGKW